MLNPSRSSSVTSPVEQARDQIRRERLVEVLMSYANTIEKMAAVHQMTRNRATIKDYATALHKGLKSSDWPWTKAIWGKRLGGISHDIKETIEDTIQDASPRRDSWTKNRERDRSLTTHRGA